MQGGHLYVWLALDPVEVFMQAIQQEGQQLLTVLLAVALELRGKLSKLVLETGGRHRCCVTLHAPLPVKPQHHSSYQIERPCINIANGIMLIASQSCQ